MRICIGGKNNIAVSVCEYIREFYPDMEVYAIPNKNDDGADGFQRSLKKYAEENGVEVVTLKDVYEWEDLIFLSTEFDRIIRPDRFKSKELFNIHFSKLPKYKGCHTAAMPILNDERITAVTFHLMEAGIDTGDIIDQKDIMISEDETCSSLYLKLIETGTQVVIANLPAVVNHSYLAHPQPAADSTYYSRTEIDYATVEVDFNRTAKQIDSQIRAYSFRAFQLPKYGNTPIAFTQITSSKSIDKPGTMIAEDDYSFRVATIDYDIILYKDRFEYIQELVKDGNIDALRQIPCLSKYVTEHEKTHGWTLLMVAAYNNQLETAKYLVSLGSDINARNHKGTTVIMFAKNGMLNTNDDRLFKYLLSKGANPYLKDYAGKNLFEYIDENLKLKILKMTIN